RWKHRVPTARLSSVRRRWATLCTALPARSCGSTGGCATVFTARASDPDAHPDPGTLCVRGCFFYLVFL
ncbi:MAG: hypothetical protein AABZ92_03480, partial [Verrucomicrobiota bacterium]